MVRGQGPQHGGSERRIDPAEAGQLRRRGSPVIGSVACFVEWAGATSRKCQRVSEFTHPSELFWD